MFLAAFDPASISFSTSAFLLLMIPLVLVHELGHFLAAKAFGITVVEFGIGLPPRVKRLGWRKGGTLYSVNWLPIGGFVRLLGEEDGSDPKSFAAAPAWKRLVVMFAGVAMNIALAVVVMAVSFMVPRERSLSLAQVAEVASGSPAAAAIVTGEMTDGATPLQGVQPGDLVLTIEGRQIHNTSELVFATRLNLGKTQDWLVNRHGSLLHAQVYARWGPPEGEGPTGVRVGPPLTCSAFDDAGDCARPELLYPFVDDVSYAPWTAARKGFWALTESMILGKNEIQVRLNGGGGAANTGPAVQGPVGIAALTGDIIKEAGWRPIIEIVALMSLNLGLFNVLPLPMLDGGKMAFIFLELLRGGRRIAPRKEAFVHLAGFALMLVGVLVMTWFDVARLVS